MERRNFLKAIGLGGLAAGSHAYGLASQPPTAIESFNPWIELSRSAVRDNIRKIVEASGGKRLMLVTKANGYGQGAVEVASIVEDMPEVWGFMVARPYEALELVNAGSRKPVFLMAPATDEESLELANAGVTLSMTAKDTPDSVEAISRRLGRPFKVHLEIDTGIHRQGMPHQHAVDWGVGLHRTGAVEIEGIASYFIVPPDSEPQTSPWNPELQQITRFNTVMAGLRESDVPLGIRHMVSSRSFFQYPQAYYDALRLGILPTGCFPTPQSRATSKVSVRQTYEMKAMIAHTMFVPAGEYIGYGQKHAVGEGGKWIATILSGGTRSGNQVLINGRLCPILLGGPRLYTVADLGTEKTANVGDIATITGRSDPQITAEGLGNPWFGYVLADKIPVRIVA